MKIKDNTINKLKNRNVLNLESWDSFIDFINDHKQELRDCIYRGQRNPEWELTPSFFRLKPSEYDWKKLQYLAFNHHLQNFYKFTRGRCSLTYNDDHTNEMQWWALGQHYGLETPLLDWVRSPYVAAYFGFVEEGDEQSRAIFILDIERIKQILYGYRGGPPIKHTIEMVEPLTHENKIPVASHGVFLPV